jgi:hypothetical protein
MNLVFKYYIFGLVHSLLCYSFGSESQTLLIVELMCFLV